MTWCMSGSDVLWCGGIDQNRVWHTNRMGVCGTPRGAPGVQVQTSIQQDSTPKQPRGYPMGSTRVPPAARMRDVQDSGGEFLLALQADRGVGSLSHSSPKHVQGWALINMNEKSQRVPTSTCGCALKSCACADRHATSTRLSWLLVRYLSWLLVRYLVRGRVNRRRPGRPAARVTGTLWSLLYRTCSQSHDLFYLLARSSKFSNHESRRCRT